MCAKERAVVAKRALIRVHSCVVTGSQCSVQNCTLLIVGRLVSRGGTAKTPPRTLVDSGVEAGRSEVTPRPQARHPDHRHHFLALSSSKDVLQPPIGYQTYCKEREDTTTKWRSRTRRTSSRTSRRTMGTDGAEKECEKQQFHPSVRPRFSGQTERSFVQVIF